MEEDQVLNWLLAVQICYPFKTLLAFWNQKDLGVKGARGFKHGAWEAAKWVCNENIVLESKVQTKAPLRQEKPSKNISKQDAEEQEHREPEQGTQTQSKQDQLRLLSTNLSV